nr:hypothetical protein BaRGS_011755 [Batillaria attramentaria]
MLLQMNRGYLNFSIDLGSTQTERGVTEVTAGSLLDDDQWHDVIIQRENKKLKVVVDRLVNLVETNGLFYRLDLDKFINIGGVEHFMQDGIKVKYNFNGCIQNVNLNGARLIADAQTQPRIQSITIHGGVGSFCGMSAATPVTFPTLESHIKLEATSSTGIMAQFDFRTHDEDGLLVYHPMAQEDSGLTVIIDEDGFVSYRIVSDTGQLVEDVVRNNDVTRASDSFADGLWHTLFIEVTDKKVNCTVDRNVKVSNRDLDVTPAVTYYLDNDGSIITSIGHDSQDWITVNGYQDPGSYVRMIKYAADDMLAMEDIIERADRCRQFIDYMCNSSKLLAPYSGDSTDQNIRTYSWWVGRTYQPMYYWGGAAPGSGKCACGLEEKGCVGGSTTCNCDAGLPEQYSDKGYLVHKDYLPVMELHFGDTGTVTDSKLGRHKLGPLECFGDDLFDNTVTFNMPDATLEFPTFEANNAGDIWYQFKTTVTDGVMVHCTGDTDFIEISLFQSDTIQFRYDVGNGVSVLSFRSPAPLNDDRWHTVHVEKNRQQAWMRIDDFTEVTLNEDADLIRLLDLKTPLFIGALVDYNDGYVGCMRGLRVNGKLMDMSGQLRQGEVYGVVREVGVNLKQNYMVRYEFDETQGLSATDFQYATIGFSTKVKQGILMQLKSVETPDYISVEMNNNGGVKVVFDVGFQREEVNTPNIGIDFANTQVHVVTVDNYPPVDYTFPVSESSDTILDKPKYLYVGNNDTTNTNFGFEGCIYRMQVDNIFPLKRAFQDPRPDYIQMTPEVAVTVFFLVVVIILIFVFRARFEGGDYETEEATGAEYADDPDQAVVYNQTGLPNMTNKFEFFM